MKELNSNLNGIGEILWSGSTYEVGEHELTKDASGYNFFLVVYAISENFYTEVVYKTVETKLTKDRINKNEPFVNTYHKPITINNNSFTLSVGEHGNSQSYGTGEFIYIKSIRGLF